MSEAQADLEIILHFLAMTANWFAIHWWHIILVFLAFALFLYTCAIFGICISDWKMKHKMTQRRR